MEIIHLILGKANPQRMNGVNKVVHQLATEQSKAGKPVFVWGITKDISVNFEERNFETRLFKTGIHPFKLSNELRSAIREKAGKAVFHFHGGWIPLYYSASRLMNRLKIPYVLTPHGAFNTEAIKKSRWKKRLYFKLFENTLLRKAKHIHVLGESEKDGLYKISVDTDPVLIPYGYALKDRQKTAEPEEEFVIGFIGRIDIYTKGLDLLLLAFETFRKDHPKSKLWIIGDSHEKPQLEKMIPSSCVDDIILWGSKFGEEKFNLLESMNVFAHPSRNEGLPTAVLEAAEMGIPSVVSKATNMGKYIVNYNAGMCVENEDVSGLAEAFNSLYQEWESGTLNYLGEKARYMVKEAFSWSHLVDSFQDLYEV